MLSPHLQRTRWLYAHRRLWATKRSEKNRENPSFYFVIQTRNKGYMAFLKSKAGILQLEAPWKKNKPTTTSPCSSPTSCLFALGPSILPSLCRRADPGSVRSSAEPPITSCVASAAKDAVASSRLREGPSPWCSKGAPRSFAPLHLTTNRRRRCEPTKQIPHRAGVVNLRETRCNARGA